jgi:hypothetical protein
MLQQILTLIIVASAVTWSVYQIVRFFRETGKGKVCSCASCPMKKSIKKPKAF